MKGTRRHSKHMRAQTIIETYHCWRQITQQATVNICILSSYAQLPISFCDKPYAKMFFSAPSKVFQIVIVVIKAIVGLNAFETSHCDVYSFKAETINTRTKEQFTHESIFSHYVLTSMPIESRPSLVICKTSLELHSEMVLQHSSKKKNLK